MKLWIPFAIAAAVLMAVAMVIMPHWDLPPQTVTQIGYRGTGMYDIKDQEDEAVLVKANVVPGVPYEPDPEGQKAGDVYENVQVLGHLSEDEFNQLMMAITQWTTPDNDCNYCHDPENLASDAVYTKVVSRRMLQMTQAINADWKTHVAETGVTCYTCHRGQNIPPETWSTDLGPKMAGYLGYRADQNIVAETAGHTALPNGGFDNYLLGDKSLLVHSKSALPNGSNKTDLTDAERTFGLMIHMSEGLGVGCITCHNTRAFDNWDESPPQRVTAWHGIRLTRALNNDYMAPMTPVMPANRVGPEGDILKVDCATCHNGVQKPLYGAPMVQDYLKGLGTKTFTGVPDFTTWKEGETERLLPMEEDKTSDAGTAATSAQLAVN
ncbi:photosynthetic reaction center cytochrome c subunit [Rhodobium orientis]|uniref:Photosynthetic reaction center cytochrome c subunit n=1 Tax=Rhodobium orientis TaxID=34017 RepID=A0A327JN01_9HYPH|nr:photosynthetic reaction center cytochrome PufC [Rhodobium orientis]MBB4303314.1 photosynthetic reaction center cytochrome c subunit [Rhodobium orientis]MBK5951591.1 photosynthetic reaction center cytochrome c subunit [Rhodobium orientis]RAI27799.1 photosynthetic reaction center cytochrome c subunit [Rhodobium orientis]